MSRIRATTIAAFASALFLAPAARAQTFLTAELLNSNEPGSIVPTLQGGAPRPVSFGSATFVLNAAQTAMTFTATVFNIDFTGLQSVDPNDNLTAAHIHAGPGSTPTLPVVWGFFGAPLNDNNPNDVVITPFTSGIGGVISGKWDAPEGNGAGVNLASQLPNILTNHAYINFHTVQFGGGEIRGTLTIAPEPGTILLMASGLFAVAVAARARNRRAR